MLPALPGGTPAWTPHLPEPVLSSPEAGPLTPPDPLWTAVSTSRTSVRGGCSDPFSAAPPRVARFSLLKLASACLLPPRPGTLAPTSGAGLGPGWLSSLHPIFSDFLAPWDLCSGLLLVPFFSALLEKPMFPARSRPRLTVRVHACAWSPPPAPHPPPPSGNTSLRGRGSGH